MKPTSPTEGEEENSDEEEEEDDNDDGDKIAWLASLCGQGPGPENDEIDDEV